MSLTLEAIATKVRARRPIHNLAGQVIALTNQQAAVLRYMCRDGLQHKQIAHELGQSLNSIREISAAIGKLAGCKTPAQLGAWAAKQGIV